MNYGKREGFLGLLSDDGRVAIGMWQSVIATLRLADSSSRLQLELHRAASIPVLGSAGSPQIS